MALAAHLLDQHGVGPGRPLADEGEGLGDGAGVQVGHHGAGRGVPDDGAGSGAWVYGEDVGPHGHLLRWFG